MEKWWERHPYQLDAEKAALNRAGYPWTIDEAAWEEGRIELDIAVADPDGEYSLRAVYPDSYPYFPPMVSRGGAPLPRHHNLFGKNLCLLAREGEQWRPGQDTLAVLLTEQLPLLKRVVSASIDAEFVSANEDHVAEPFSSFLPYQINSSVIVPDETPDRNVAFGKLLLRARSDQPEHREAPFLSGAIQKITDMGTKVLVGFTPDLPELTVGRTGYWVRLDARPEVPVLPPQQSLEAHFFELLAAKVPDFKKAFDNGKRGQIIVGGFVYPDEVSWRATGDDWFFIVARIVRERKGARPAKGTLFFVRADWGGETSWVRRAPTLRPLRKKAALIIGLGSLGSSVVLQLAKSGIGALHLLDFDYLQVGNTIRWGLGWRFSGLSKTTALAIHLRSEYPYAKVYEYNRRIGEAGSPEYEKLLEICSQVDLIIDASAHPRVSHFIADLSRRVFKPYLWLTTTHGAAGGIVGRIIPARTAGCWHCFLRTLADKIIDAPADSGEAEIQPGGCSQPTFIGAGVDSDEIALMASRLAIATLSLGAEDGYADFPFDVAVVDLYKGSRPLIPCWKEYMLAAHPDCAACSQK